MFQNFIAEVFLETPVIFGRSGLMGDSWLAGIAYGEHRDPERAIRELPITLIEDIPQISKALCYVPISRRNDSATLIQSIMRDIDHDPAIADMLAKMPPKSMRTPSQGPLGNVQNSYRLNHLSSLYFIGNGDIDKVRRLMNGVTFMGSQHSKGFGQIVRVEVWSVDSDNPWYGIVGVKAGRNVVLRPVPLRLRDLLPEQLDFLTSTETWHNPYNRGLPGAIVEPCMVPPFNVDEAFSPDDIKRLSHLAA